MFEEMVVRETVKPTDCALTSQKHTNLPQVVGPRRYAMHAAAIVREGWPRSL